MIRILFNTTDIWILILLGMILGNGHVWWITGVSFEEAMQAGPQRRKAFTWAHLVRIGTGSLTYLVFSVLFTILRLSWRPDLAVWLITLIGAALSTIHIRL